LLLTTIYRQAALEAGADGFVPKMKFVTHLLLATLHATGKQCAQAAY